MINESYTLVDIKHELNQTKEVEEAARKLGLRFDSLLIDCFALASIRVHMREDKRTWDKFFFFVKEKGFLGIRIFNLYFKYKNLNYHNLLFSERQMKYKSITLFKKYHFSFIHARPNTP